MKEIRDIVAAFARAQEQKMAAALATVISVEGSSYRQAGARMLITEDGCMTGAISGGCLEGDALRKAKLVMDRGQAKLVRYDTNDEDDAQMGLGLGCKGIIDVLIEPVDAAATGNPIQLLAQTCGHREPQLIVTHASRNPGRPSLGTCLLLGAATTNPDSGERFGSRARAVLAGGRSELEVVGDEVCFYEILQPELRLIICGAGNDAIPLTQLAAVLGWETHVTDGRPAYLSAARFPLATALHLLTVNQAELPLVADQRTVAVLMSHNYNYDIAMLRRLLPANLPYIGALGPKRKLLRMLDELGIDAEAMPECLHGPTGLDIGASTPEEIALSIFAEIQSVMSRRAAESLRERLKPIHQL